MWLHEKMPDRKRALWGGVALALLIGLSSVIHSFWIAQNEAPPIENGIPYIINAMRYYHTYCDFGGAEVLNIMRGILPGVSLSDVAFLFYYCVMGIQTTSEHVVSIVYLGVGALGLYGVGRLLMNRRAGLLAVLIFYSLPGVLVFSKLGHYEFHLMCLLPMALYFLVKSDLFQKRIASFGAGACIAALVITKYEAAVSIAFPFLAVLVCAWVRAMRGDVSKKIVLCNACVCVFSAAVLTALWYSFLSASTVGYYFDRAHGSGVHKVGFELVDLFYYCASFVTYIMSPDSALFFLIGIAVYFVCAFVRKKCSYATLVVLLLCVSMFVPIVLFTFVVPKNHSHILTSAVFASLVAAAIVVNLRIRIVRSVVIFLILLQYCCVNLEYVCGYPDAQSPYLTVSPLGGNRSKVFAQSWLPDQHFYPDRNGWDLALQRVLQTLLTDVDRFRVNANNANLPKVMVLSEWGPLNLLREFLLHYYSMKHPGQRRWEIRWAGWYDEPNLWDANFWYFVSDMPLPASYKGKNRNMKIVCDAISNERDRFSQNFTLIKEIAFPDNRKVYCYRNNRIVSNEL